MIFNSRKIREELGMSQQDFANLIGVSMSTVSNWDNYKTSVQLMIRPRILAVMKSLGFAKVEFEFEGYEDVEEGTPI